MKSVLKRISWIIIFVYSHCFITQAQDPPLGESKTYKETLVNNFGQQVNLSIKLRWVEVFSDKICCSEKTSDKQYHHPSTFDNNEKAIIKGQLNKDFSRAPMFPNLKNIGTEIKNRGRNRGYPHRDELFNWEEDDNKTGNNALAGLFGGNIKWEAPTCGCLDINRYQLHATYTFEGTKPIDRYLHEYYIDEQSSPADCPDPECNNKSQDNPITGLGGEAKPQAHATSPADLADKGPTANFPMLRNNKSIQIDEEWIPLWDKSICCGQKLSENYYVNSAEFSNEEKKSLKELKSQMMMFEGAKTDIAGFGIWLRQRAQFSGSLKNLDALFIWAEKDKHVKDEGLASKLGAKAGNDSKDKKIEFQAGPCECLDIIRYQLLMTYHFSDKIAVDHYAHKYKNEVISRYERCKNPKCGNKQSTASPTTGDPPDQFNASFEQSAMPQLGDHYSIVNPDPLGLPPGITASATGTGRTTGHIADLLISNTTNEPVEIVIGPLYIPSRNGYQSYVVVEPQIVTIDPNSEITVPVSGYCGDIHKPPVPPGEPLPPTDEWITPESAISLPTPGTEIDPEGPYNPLAPGTTPDINYPGTTVPFPYTVDQTKNPAVAASFIVQTADLLPQIYDELQETNPIITPYAGNPEKQKEIVLQHTLWVASSALEGDPYVKEELQENMEIQVEELTGKTISEAPPAQQESFQDGVDSLWDSFILLGTEAKVLREEEKEK